MGYVKTKKCLVTPTSQLKENLRSKGLPRTMFLLTSSFVADKCSTNQCHENLAACRITYGKEECFCKDPLTSSGRVRGPKCTLGKMKPTTSGSSMKEVIFSLKPVSAG